MASFSEGGRRRHMETSARTDSAGKLMELTEWAESKESEILLRVQRSSKVQRCM